MDYGEILSKAWKTIWKHKILWLFGILAGCGASGGGGSSVSSVSNISNSASTSFKPESFDFLAPSTQQSLTDFGQSIANVPVIVWVLLLFGLIIGGTILLIAFFLLGTLGETGLIAGVSLADEEGEDVPQLSFGRVFSALKPHYWKVVLLKLGYLFASFLITLILIFPTIILMFCTCCLGFLLLIPLGWLLQILITFTLIAIVEEGLGVFPAISRAWQMITSNLLHVLVMFLILTVGGAIIGLMIVVPLFIIPVPLIINLVITAASGSGTLIVGLIFSVLLFIVFFPVMLLLSGVLRAYIMAAWTLTYRRLAANESLKPTLLDKTTPED
ncbi:MAG: hypothetical protein GX142_09060 [Chloroflexi bacterium]|jgi:hypothetical protein|nr:hypothetical protein [Chloroflexota bacterium]